MNRNEPTRIHQQNGTKTAPASAAVASSAQAEQKQQSGPTAAASGVNSFKNNYDKSDIKPTKRRFIILLIFCLHSMINALQWIYLSSITSTLTDFYGVDNMAVNWTSMIFMLVYIPLVVPASWLFERIGMRSSILLGSLGTSLGSLIKCFSCRPGRFYLVMAGQTIVAVSQLFVLSVPPRLASVWFPDHQVALANACGVFGNQLGIALGFVVPQLVLGPAALTGGSSGAAMQQGLFNLFVGIATISCTVSLLIVCLFEESPTKAPGLARLQQIKQENAMAEQSGIMPLVHDTNCDKTKAKSGFGSMLWILFTDKNFVMLIIGYGLLVGVFYAISTVLNQMIAPKSLEAPVLSGRLGLVMVISGMCGSVVSGYILDKTHMYRLVNASLYLLSLLAMVAFAVAIEFTNQLAYYLAIILLGYFMTGYLLIGFEMSNEITWPLPESVTAGLLNLSAQVFGVILTYSGSFMVDHHGSMAANIFFICSLLVGLLVTIMIKAQMKRQSAIEVDI